MAPTATARQALLVRDGAWLTAKQCPPLRVSPTSQGKRAWPAPRSPETLPRPAIQSFPKEVSRDINTN